MWNFFIRRCFELCDVDFDEFNLLFLSIGIVPRICQGISKNQRVDIIQYSTYQHQFVVDCLVSNVIKIFKELTCQRPSQWLGEKLGPHPLLLCPKPQRKASNDVWFMTIPIGRHQLRLIVDKLTVDFFDFCDKMLLYKMDHGVEITRMEEALVLVNMVWR